MRNSTIAAVVVGILALIGVAYFLNQDTDVEEVDTDDVVIVDDEVMEDDDSMMEEGVMVGGAMMTPDRDIVTNAMDSSDHTTLVAAVEAAALVETLQGEGPYTVFAPTNDAFDALPEGTVDTLLLPENSEDLSAVLTYHVVAGEYTSEDLTDGMTLTTVQGETLTLTQDDEGNWWINETAMVTVADVLSSNGVTHVVDAVLVPSTVTVQ